MSVMPSSEKNPDFFARFESVWNWTCGKVHFSRNHLARGGTVFHVKECANIGCRKDLRRKTNDIHARVILRRLIFGHRQRHSQRTLALPVCDAQTVGRLHIPSCRNSCSVRSVQNSSHSKG